MQTPEIPTVPDHELLRLIGRGSYGEVWLASNALSTPRAVKIVQRSKFDSDRPYIREFSGIKKFEPISRSHDGLVDILQVGRNDAAGFFYYVMELADDALPNASGETSTSSDTTTFFRRVADSYRPRTLASDVKAKGRLPIGDALPLFIDLAVAVGHLHAHGLLHRDVKPANVIFVSGVPKLADIGLVAEASESATFVGTEGFIPPEGPGTVSADLYALGKLMYEAVTGRDRQDFPALTLDRGDPAQNTELIEINEILLRCCDPNPAKRYRNAAELQTDLAVLRSGHSVQRLRAYERGFRLARKIGAVAIAAAAIAIGVSFFFKRQERVATENFGRAEVLRQRAERAEHEANERLYASLVARADAERRSGLAKARENVLAAVRQAAQLHEATAELRSEAIAGLALLDFPEKRRWKSESKAYLGLCLSPDTRFIAEAHSNGFVSVKSTDSGAEVARFWTGGPEVEWLGPFSPDGRWLVAATPSPLGAKVWDLEKKTNAPTIDRRIAWKYLRFLGKSSTLVGAAENKVYLMDLPNDETERFELPVGAIYYSTSPDGALAAYTHPDSDALHLWDLRKRRDRQILDIPPLAVLTAHWSLDGSLLAVSMVDHLIRVWQLTETNATPLAVFEGHRAEATGLQWAPDNRLLVSSGWDDTTRIWEMANRREATMFQKTSWSPQFTADGKHFSVYENLSKELVLSEVRKSDICRLLPEPGPPQEKSPYAVQFTPDSRWLLTGGYDGLRAYRTSDGQLVSHFETAPVRDFVMFPDPSHHFVVFSPPNRLLGGWQAPANGGLEFVPPRAAERGELARLHPKQYPWVGNLLSKIRIYSADGSEYDLPESYIPVKTLLSPGGQFVAATFIDHHAGFWRLGKEPLFQNLGPCRGYAVAFSPDDRHVYHATYLDLYSTSTETGTTEWRVQLGDSPQPNAAIEVTPDGNLLAVVMNQYKVTLVDPHTGRILADLEHPDRQLINSIALSPDGTYLAVACSGHVVQLWNLRAMRSELAEMHLDW